jgi:hypothetical protein
MSFSLTDKENDMSSLGDIQVSPVGEDRNDSQPRQDTARLLCVASIRIVWITYHQGGVCSLAKQQTRQVERYPTRLSSNDEISANFQSLSP